MIRNCYVLRASKPEALPYHEVISNHCPGQSDASAVFVSTIYLKVCLVSPAYLHTASGMRILGKYADCVTMLMRRYYALLTVCPTFFVNIDHHTLEPIPIPRDFSCLLLHWNLQVVEASTEYKLQTGKEVTGDSAKEVLFQLHL